MVSAHVLPLHAQRWERVYTGGTYKVGISQAIPDSSTGSSSGDANGSRGGGSTNSLSPGLSESVDCSGEITATFTWVAAYGSGPPPPSPTEVIVEETASASWNGGPSSTGSCENGIGSPEIPALFSGSSSGVRYVKKSVSGNSFTISCSPISNVRTVTTPTTYTRNNVSVSYGAKVVPFGIVLNGVTRVGNGDQLVVGQGCIPEVIYGSAVTSVTGVVWSFSGGKPFKSYVVTSLPNADMTPGSTGTLNPIDGTNKNGSKPVSATHFAKNESVTISCTGTANFSSGMLQSFSPSATLTVVAPKHEYKGVMGSVAIASLEGVKYLVAIGPGITYKCLVVPPAGFGAGEYSVMQLVSSVIQIQTTSGTTTSGTGGTFQLDGTYPYAGWKPDMTPPGILDPYSQDFPGVQLIGDRIRVDIEDLFKAFMMYYPVTNGIGCQTVPLTKQDWKFQAVASRPDPMQEWKIISSTLTGGASERVYDHPLWANVINPLSPTVINPKP